MSNVLSGLGYANDVKEDKDTLGGARPALNSDVYEGTIKLAYIEESQYGALGLNLTLDIPNYGEYKETLWMTNRQKQNFYVTSTNEKRYLAGFTHADSLALLTTGKPLSELKTEQKLVKTWVAAQKAEMNVQVDVIVDLIGKKVSLGIHKELQIKQEKDANGIYQDTDKTRETNSINKVFHPTNGKTVAECKAKVETPEFREKWLAQWKDKVNDRTGGKAGQSGTPGAPKPNAAKSSSLFDD